ncbi:MAG: tRNA 2-thiouridine(34) synthase MnmA [Clostridiales bacterium]|nr:tRNA 2-thiouridine(34) synthase MnmA [Clostridiales bacterium]
MKEKVLTAMSGGVDSTVAAALLLRQGYEVVGATMDTGSGGPFAAAEKAAAFLGIEHHVVDVRRQFEEAVIGGFLREYERGRTPNPCVVCNERVKFTAFLPLMRRLGINRFATGHYARVEAAAGRFLLKRASYLPKDQSYMLFRLKQEVLSATLFPLGEMSKDEVREAAREMRLPAAGQPDSQDICFIPSGDYRAFIAERLEHAGGEIRDLCGRVVGRHNGLPYYTVGQRKGLNLALGYPAYVVGLDHAKNRLIIGREEDLYCSGALCEDINFIALECLQEPMPAAVKIRYNAEPQEAVISSADGGRVEISFREPAKAVTPGQAAVFYQGDVVIGGGTIVRAR